MLRRLRLLSLLLLLLLLLEIPRLPLLLLRLLLLLRRLPLLLLRFLLLRLRLRLLRLRRRQGLLEGWRTCQISLVKGQGWVGGFSLVGRVLLCVLGRVRGFRWRGGGVVEGV